MRLSLLLVALISLAGCRESIVGPSEIIQETPRGEEVAAIAIKGPHAPLQTGAYVQLRAQPVPDVVTFNWRFEGQGAVTVQNVPGQGGPLAQRILDIQGVRTGAIRATVEGLNAEGTRIAYGEMTFEVVNR